jgi:sugar lactone lactonase YvrE
MRHNIETIRRASSRRRGGWKHVAVALAAAVLAAGAVQAAPADVLIPGNHVYPESLTSAADGTLYIGSMAEGVVLRAAPGATTAAPFIAAGSNGILSVLGVLADDASNTLWVCSSDLSAFGVVMQTGEKPVALKAFDLQTGAPKGSYPLPGEKTLCNDIVRAADGTLYVTDSFNPHILRLKAGAEQLEVWAEDPRFTVEKGAGLDGIAIGSDGAVYVNTYNGSGLYRVALKPDGTAGAVTTLKTSQKIELADALRAIGPNTFLMIEGTGKLDRITVSGDDAKIEVVRDGFKLPVSVTVVGDTAWVVEGQLNHLFDPKLGPPAPFLVIPVSGFNK